MPDGTQKGSAHHKHRQMVCFTNGKHCFHQLQLTQLKLTERVIQAYPSFPEVNFRFKNAPPFFSQFWDSINITGTSR